MKISSRRLHVSLLTVGLLGPVLAGAPPSHAQPATECTSEMVMRLRPGISETPSAGTANGREGVQECNGPVLGEQPTGEIGHDFDGRYGTDGPDTCSGGGEGWGVANHYVPTKNGTKTFRNIFTYKFGGVSGGIVSGTFEGDYFSGTFSIRPLEGDCVTSPVTKGDLTVKGTWHEYRGSK